MRYHIVHLLTLSILYFSLRTTSIEFPITFTDGPQATLPLVVIKIGTPPQTMRLLPDTSSDTTWVFCESSPRSSDRTFHSSRSSSFRWKYRAAPSCENSIECYDWDTVEYTTEYAAGSWATGDWVTETIVARTQDGSDIMIDDVTIGCTDRKSSNFSGADGILALSRNSPSFASQMADRFGGKFSYALRDGDRLVFGDTTRNDFSRADMQYIPLVHANTSYFYAEISSLSMGDTELDIPKKVWKFHIEEEFGGVLFDSGSMKTYVPETAFHAIIDYFMESRDYLYFRMTDSEICFVPYPQSFEDILLSPLIIKFGGGAEFAPKIENLYYEDEKGYTCLNVWPMEQNEGATIGSTLQKGYFWEYDLWNQVVGFAPLES